MKKHQPKKSPMLEDQLRLKYLHFSSPGSLGYTAAEPKD